MSGKILEMPKSNQQLWDDLFRSFRSDIDKVAEHLEPEGYVDEDGGFLPDEEPWTDSKTTAEMWNSIKGR